MVCARRGWRNSSSALSPARLKRIRRHRFIDQQPQYRHPWKLPVQNGTVRGGKQALRRYRDIGHRDRVLYVPADHRDLPRKHGIDNDVAMRRERGWRRQILVAQSSGGASAEANKIPWSRRVILHPFGRDQPSLGLAERDAPSGVDVIGVVG